MTRMHSWLRTALALVGVMALSGCTYVRADAATGKIDVVTFMTSRQDVDIERVPDGTSKWSAKESKADTALAATALNLSAVMAKTAGLAVAP